MRKMQGGDGGGWEGWVMGCGLGEDISSNRAACLAMNQASRILPTTLLLLLFVFPKPLFILFLQADIKENIWLAVGREAHVSGPSSPFRWGD